MTQTSDPWDKPNPRKKAGKASKPLSAKKKTKAKSIARSHGRSKPSLVDNMNAARSKKASTKKASAKGSSAKKASTKKASTKRASTKKASTKRVAIKSASAKKTSAKKASVKAPAKASKRTTNKSPGKASGASTKDPSGGLTAAGRAEFARKDGSQLKPGVQSHGNAMSPQDMKRKGSWAVRFYGRDPLPPLVDKKGGPTRLALSAHAWGEPVPKTEAAARRIAAKGRKLLDRYEKTKEK